MNNIVKLENISTVRNEALINDNVSVIVHSGTGLVLRGKNGVGKTTLMRAIAGYLPISSGTISINNACVSEVDLASVCHFIGEAGGLKDYYSVQEDLSHWASVAGIAKNISKDNIVSALEAFGISDLAHTKTTMLSQGQKKRVALSRLLVLNRPIWLLDEPTNGLDKATIKKLNSVIENHLSQGGIVICASHLDINFKHIKHTLEMAKV